MKSLANHPAKMPATVTTLLTMVAATTMLLYFTPRPNFILTYILFLLLFVGYFVMIRQVQAFPLRLCIALAVVLRLMALFSLPVLSDDYFRFIWDGKMTMAHVNPFHFAPAAYLAAHPGDAYLQSLVAQMNSADYNSVYPPVLQYIFAFAVWLFPTSAYGAVVVMKLFIFLSECLTIRVLYLYLIKKKIPVRNMLWYVLNPMIIIELTGNVHFEGILICFFMAMLWWLNSKKYLAAGVMWALTICTKMTPLMLAPLLLWHLGWRKFSLFGGVAVLATSLLFAPFLDRQLGDDIGSSLRLFYHLFEFNAPVFYLIRTIAYHYVNYDVIEEVAPKLGIISFFIILAVSFWPRGSRSIETRSLWIFSIYFLFATMVHPWYISILVLLSVFSRYRFPVIFSILIPLSYFPYSLKDYDEDMRVILLEYGLLALFMLVEWRWIKRKGYSPVHLSDPLHSTPN